MAKGCKLHAAWSTRPLPEAWAVTPLNASEKAVAEGLVGRLGYGGYLPGDGNSGAGYRCDAAHERGYRLVAPCGKAASPGCGRHCQGPHRLRSIALLQGDFGTALWRARAAIARSFGHGRSFGGGPWPAAGAHLGVGETADQRRPHPEADGLGATFAKRWGRGHQG